ncbi:MAG: methionine adenosyltransferase [Synergistaceae bacterium]|jgi:S-adenosylmethionine synthetase|nr:methionine adenosyltransferase [Synergistaceae bacterium]
MPDYFITSESVTEGHPDKLCDQIADALLDEYMSRDRDSRVAIEVMAAGDVVLIAGEVTSGAPMEMEAVEATARRVIGEAGYTRSSGIDCRNCLIMTHIRKQSADIKIGVDKKADKATGAGDQGIMYGYATAETENFMPLPIALAHRLARRLAELRKDRTLPWLRPDGKTQVTVRYGGDGGPLYVSGVVVSTQHDESVDIGDLRPEILNRLIMPVLGDRWFNEKTAVYINPTGRFILGGPTADTGLTGRKIMVDTYGGAAKHGGGAFSGKDPTKVDRSAAYMARYAAKNLVACGLADRCEVSAAYAIGLPEPVAINVCTFGTGKIDDEKLSILTGRIFPFSVDGIMEELDLRNTKYRPAAVYGHFGRSRENSSFTWETVKDLSRCI